MWRTSRFSPTSRLQVFQPAFLFQLLPARNMSSQRPAWLTTLLNEKSTPTKLYAWNPSNLSLPGRETEASLSPCDLDRRIFVLGVGNLGRLFASSLARLPNRPRITLVVHREELLVQWERGEGLVIERSGVVERNKDFDIELWTDCPPRYGPVREVADGGKLRNLIVTTKVGAALPQVDRVRGYLGKESTVVFAQNGMSKLWPPHGPTYVASRFAAGEAPTFLACVTTHGLTSLGNFRSLHASLSNVTVGPVLSNPQAPPITPRYLEGRIVGAPILQGSAVPKQELWVLQLEKLVVNCIINPLTAILRCKNGALFSQRDGPISRVLDRLLLEISQVLQALICHDSSENILLSSPSTSSHTNALQPELPIGRIRDTLAVRFSHGQLRDLVYRVGLRVKDNTSSMLQDVRAGKLTEISDFNGWVVETATFLDPHLDVRGNQVLIDLVENDTSLSEDELLEHFKLYISKNL